MKVNVQNPIQSLQTFGCHFNRGRSAALPLIFSFLFAAIFFVTGVSAQNDSRPASVDEKRLDLLFNEIMETLPDQERSRVDSAATVTTRSKQLPQSPSTESHRNGTVPVQTRLNGLPDELRGQVERAIVDMEQRKEERKIQFRESRKSRERQ